EHHAVAVRSPGVRCPIECPVSTQNHANGSVSVTAVEVMQRAVAPAAVRLRELEDLSVPIAGRTVALSCAIQIAGSIDGQRVHGPTSRRIRRETDQRVQRPAAIGWRELEDGAPLAGATRRRRTVKISHSITHQSAYGHTAIASTGEAVQRL